MGLLQILGKVLGIHGPDTKRLDNVANAGYGQANARNDAFYNALTSRMPAAQVQGQSLLDKSMGMYQGAYDKASDPTSNPAYGGFASMAGNGGLDPNDLVDQERNIAAYRGEGDFGRNLMDTGGWTSADKQNLRARSASGIPAMFTGLRNQLASSSAAQGGYNPGYTSQTAKMMRDQTSAAIDNTRNTELGLADSIRAGKISGSDILDRSIGGAGNIRNSIMGARQQGKQFGLSGLSNLGQNSIQGMLGAAGGTSGLYSAAPGLEDMIMRSLGGSIDRGAGLTSQQLQAIMGSEQMKQAFIQSLIAGGVGAAGAFAGGGKP